VNDGKNGEKKKKKEKKEKKEKDPNAVKEKKEKDPNKESKKKLKEKKKTIISSKFNFSVDKKKEFANDVLRKACDDGTAGGFDENGERTEISK